jgi:hypothetical protein
MLLTPRRPSALDVELADAALANGVAQQSMPRTLREFYMGPVLGEPAVG